MFSIKQTQHKNHAKISRELKKKYQPFPVVQLEWQERIQGKLRL